MGWARNCPRFLLWFSKCLNILFNQIQAINRQLVVKVMNIYCFVTWSGKLLWIFFIIMSHNSVFIKSRKPTNFVVYCGIFSGYFISDKNKSVLIRDHLYVFWDCLYSGSIFDSMCLSPFFRFETRNQSLLDLNDFCGLTLASFLC